jgi:hypothetical protein
MRLCEGSQQFTYKGSKVCDILKESSLRLGDVETNTGVLTVLLLHCQLITHSLTHLLYYMYRCHVSFFHWRALLSR